MVLHTHYVTKQLPSFILLHQL